MAVELDVVAVIAVYSCLALCGLFGNLWVMWTVLSQLIGCSLSSNPNRTTKPPVQSSAYIYLLLLSVVDLISFVPVPLLVADILSNEWPFGEILCKLSLICEGINKALSPMVLTALSVDRYIAVCKPTLIWMRQTNFSMIVVFICILLSLLFIVPISIKAKLEPMPNAHGILVNKCTLDTKRSFDVSQAIGCYVVPLLLICSVYAAILWKLYRHTRISSVGRKTSISLSRVVKCSVMVVAFYFICWTPYFSMQLIPLLMEDSEMTSNMEMDADYEAFSTENGSLHHKNYTDSDILMEQPPSLAGSQIFLMYMMHALPYAQSAFNWLFYAFLNRNLRNSGQRANGVRSTASTFLADQNSGVSQTGLPIWKNIQHMGSQLKTASIDTGNMLLKNSPFRSKSRKQFRSSTCLDNTTLTADYLVVSPNVLTERSSMLDIRSSPEDTSPVRSNSVTASPNHQEPSATSSVEWL